MSLKTKIKNDMWHINYIVPYTAKYLQGGKVNFIKKSIPVIAKLRVVKGKGPRDVSSDITSLMEKINLDVLPGSSYFYWIDEYKTIAVRGNVLSNFPIDYDRLVNGSFFDVADKAIAVGGKYGERANNIKKAISILRDRVKATVEKKCDDKKHRDRTIEEMAVLLEQPATHFHEGLQRILFFNQYMWQTRHGLNGLGRLDKILGHLYEADLADGLVTNESAYEMVKDFMNTLSNWYVYKSSSLLGDIGQIVILAGLETDGSYFYNDVTKMFLKAQAEVKKPDPKTFIRVSEKMPDELLGAAVDALKAKTGSPLFSNDDVVIPRLVQFGINEDEAHNYCVSACWEPFIPGKSLDQNNVRAFDFFRPLDKTLDENDLSMVLSWEDVVRLYETTLTREWKAFCAGLNEFVWACDPFVSMLTDGCNESGKDISEGGAEYSNYGVTSVGMGSAVDTLFNIKKLVFDEKKYSLPELNEKRKDDFKDADGLLKELKTIGHSYAHDNEEVERLVNEILRVSNAAVKDYVNPIGGKVKFGLSSPFSIRDAKSAPADLAGRKHGDPYGTHISCIDAPYTEVVNFAGKLDYSGHAFNGNVVDYFMPAGLIDNNADKFALFMRAAIKQGFFQMQMNILDSTTLIDAKAHPERYPGLIVRVWGFSAYFNDLPEDYKDVLIKRAIKAERVA